MSTLSTCMDRYMNRYMIQQQQQQQQQQTSQSGQQQAQGYYHPNGPHPGNFMIGCYQNTNGWTGVPLISTASTRRPRKAHNNNNNNAIKINRGLNTNNSNNGVNRMDYDENTMSRLAIHAHGAPLILTGRYRHKSHKSVKHNNNNNNTINNNNYYNRDVQSNTIPVGGQPIPEQSVSKVSISSTGSDECSSLSSSPNNSNIQETCLPRIIKPRKRRKKDRKPANQLNQNQTHGDMTQISNIAAAISISSSIGDSFDEANSKFDDSDVVSTCSCRLCDPYCRIWAFPLRRSCSDNSAEIEVIQRKKNVGVIGGNRKLPSVKNEWRSTPQLMDLMDYNNISTGGSRKGSFSDSGDSGCDLLSGINFSNELLASLGAVATPSSTSSTTSSSCGIYNSELMLNENINDISKRMLESLDLKSDCGVLSTSSSDSGNNSSSNSVFSDHIYSISDVLAFPATMNLGLQDLFMQRSPAAGDENDKGSEIFNCRDMVWNGNKFLSAND